MAGLSGSVTFITGASSGIGAAVAREAARQGADVVLTARREERLQSLSAEIEAMGRRALAVRCDVTRDGDLEAAVSKALDAFGRIDHVIANAGFGVVGAFSKLRLEDFRRQFETNVFGVLRTVAATREELIATRGCLAIIGSVNGYVPFPRSSPYSMSKSAVHALAFSLWHELRPHGVGVLLVAPGFVESEIRQVDNRGEHHPRARERISPWMLGSKEKAARRIVRAVRRRRRLVVITHHARIAIFLQRHFPRLLPTLFYAFRSRRR
ncbi:MAG: SDR family oxidoreductase [Deltaproteobacteria bacterium]|jgi:short-subunit dehydrogenase|nr:SDR family oxidoreductase [Deltaproteobacteria bacterium]